MVITKEILERGKSANGGWSRKQFELLDAPWGEKLYLIIGREVADENVEKFNRYGHSNIILVHFSIELNTNNGLR